MPKKMTLKIRDAKATCSARLDDVVICYPSFALRTKELQR